VLAYAAVGRVVLRTHGRRDGVVYSFFPIPGNGGSLASNIHNSQGTVFLGREEGSTAVINVMEHDSADGSCNFWAAAQNKP
jgi:hypothetical protein